MLADLSPAQLILAEYMSFLSEEAWHAEWMQDLEFDLWRAVTDGPYQYGRLQITDQMIAKLKQLSLDCQGWIRFDEAGEEICTGIDDWLVMVGRKPA